MTLSDAVDFENDELAKAARQRNPSRAPPSRSDTGSNQVPATGRTTGLVLVATCGCGRSYTLAEFLTLPLVGFLGGSEIPERLELRNCMGCGSTISRLVP